MGPLAIAAALQVAQGIAQYQQQRQLSIYGRASLRNQMALSAEATQAQADQINNQSAIDMSARAIQAARERASLRVAAGEAGVGGNSPAISEMRSRFAEGYDLTTIKGNTAAQLKQGQLEGLAEQSRLTNEYNQLAPPSPLASVLTIGANVAGLYAHQPQAPK